MSATSRHKTRALGHGTRETLRHVVDFVKGMLIGGIILLGVWLVV